MTAPRHPLPGCVVRGPFYSDGRAGCGVVVARARPLWTRTAPGYVPVRVIVGDRTNGGYRPEDLAPIAGLVLARGA